MVGHGAAENGRLTTRLGLVIGGSGGIGLALANEIAMRGADVVIVGRDADRLAAACASVTAVHRVAATPVALDAAGPEAPAQLAEALDKIGRPLETAVIGIGRWQDGPVDSLSSDELDALFRTNVVAHQALARILLPRMEQDGGLLFVGSLAGILPLPWIGAYAASKASLHAMVLALRQEIADRGLRISLLAPGVVDTGFLPTPEKSWHRHLLALIATRPETVARAGYLGLRAGVPLIVPGLLWRGLWLGSHLVPSALRMRIVGLALSPLAPRAAATGQERSGI